MNQACFRLKSTTLALMLAAPALFSTQSHAMSLKEATELALKNSPGIINARINSKLKEADERTAHKYFDTKIEAEYTINSLGGFEYPDEFEALSLASLNTDAPKTNFLPDETTEGKFKLSLKKIYLNGIYTEVGFDLSQRDSERDKISASPAVDALNNGGLDKSVDDYFPMSYGVVKLVTRFPLWGRGDLAEAIGDYQNKYYLFEAAETELQHEIANILKKAIDAYWDNRAAADIFALRQESLERSQRWMDQINAVIDRMEDPSAVRAQYAAQLDRIEGFVQSKLRELNSAETALNESRSALAKSLGISIEKAIELGDANDAMPQPARVNSNFDSSNWNELAVNNRMDIKAKKLEQKGAAEMLDWFMNFNYPEVNLILAGHQQMVEFGAEGPGGYLDTLGSPSGDLGYTVGLQFNMKLDNSAGRGRAIQATLNKMKKEMDLKQIMNEAGVSTKSLADQVLSNIKEVESAADSAAAYKKSVDAARADKSQTIDTAYRQFETERDWVDSEVDYLEAMTKLAKTIAQVRFETGTLIEQTDENQQVDLQKLVTLPTR
ncbi:TolC family protein [Ectothiorhodospiraceae bacterium BW-2]|nr:TolC family protein [Ectothiorhodospiraceae bacterium BW-2]